MSSAASPGPGLIPLGELCAEEKTVLANAGPALELGLQLRRWFESAERSGCFSRKFELTRTAHEHEESYGFFGEVPLKDGRAMPVMGNVQEMFFDHAKPMQGGDRVGAEVMRRQTSEFVLRYFMRVGSFQLPEPYAEPDQARAGGWPSWCGGGQDAREGFGYTQHFAKPRGGEPGRFDPARHFRIVDLRELGPVWDWVIARLRFFDFQIGIRPAGASGPEIAFDLEPQNYIVLSPELVWNRTDPEPGVVGEYGFGYAAIRLPKPSVIAYGPGHFQAAVQVMRWRILESGQIRARLEFISNRPERVSQVSVDPVRWALWTARAATLGLASPLLARAEKVWAGLPNFDVQFDPLLTGIELLNAVTRGRAARDWCISREQIDKELLLLHFRQHYREVLGCLRVWRQIPDWTDEQRLPPWIREGSAEK